MYFISILFFLFFHAPFHKHITVYVTLYSCKVWSLIIKVLIINVGCVPLKNCVEGWVEDVKHFESKSYSVGPTGSLLF